MGPNIITARSEYTAVASTLMFLSCKLLHILPENARVVIQTDPPFLCQRESNKNEAALKAHSCTPGSDRVAVASL